MALRVGWAWQNATHWHERVPALAQWQLGLIKNTALRGSVRNQGSACARRAD
jgi:hypothetical protein